MWNLTKNFYYPYNSPSLWPRRCVRSCRDSAHVNRVPAANGWSPCEAEKSAEVTIYENYDWQPYRLSPLRFKCRKEKIEWQTT
nr:MAG TPA: hypothetical protein [Caudoviricetes sp.]